MKILFHCLLAASLFISVKSLVASRTDEDKRIFVRDKEFTVSIHHDDISKRVKEIAAQINKDYAGKKPIFVGVLNGAVIFLSDLVREVTLECEIDFIKVSSYGNSTSSSGDVTLSKGLSCCAIDRDIIIVEDIIDSGASITFVKELIEKAHPRSVRIVALLHKNLSEFDFPIDYVGFEIQPEFVVGYGLDFGQIARNLKDIYKLAE